MNVGKSGIVLALLACSTVGNAQQILYSTFGAGEAFLAVAEWDLDGGRAEAFPEPLWNRFTFLMSLAVLRERRC